MRFNSSAIVAIFQGLSDSMWLVGTSTETGHFHDHAKHSWKVLSERGRKERKEKEKEKEK